MAWLDDRFWAHNKVVGLTDRSFRVYVNSICYAAGMSTRGHLDESQIKLIGGRKREKTELISRRLWRETSTGILIHDWDEHNDKRDEKRAADRERKRLARAKERAERALASAGQSADSPLDSPQDSVVTVLRTAAGQTADKSYAEEVKGEGLKNEEQTHPNPTQPVDVAEEQSRLALVASIAAGQDHAVRDMNTL